MNDPSKLFSMSFNLALLLFVRHDDIATDTMLWLDQEQWLLFGGSKQVPKQMLVATLG